MSHDKLIRRIIRLSEGDEWNPVRRQWKSVGITLSDEVHRCICGHKIKQLCHIKNRITKKRTVVGTCCIKQFKGLQSPQRIFSALKKGKLNEALINWARDKDIITRLERAFALNHWMKRKHSAEDRELFAALTHTILTHAKDNA
jgi:hypothetical protein